MRHRFLLTLCLVLATLPCTHAAAAPHFLVIIADDLGYSDLGCYGGEIATPHLDALAKGGLRFTQFYNTGRCWPTRSALLSGYYPQQIRRDALPDLTGRGFGGQGTRPSWATLLPTRLQPLGYRCYHSGKWHVDGDPTANGFHHSYHLKDQGRFFNPKSLFLDDQPLPPIPPGSGYYSTIAVADQAIAQLQAHANQHPNSPFFSYLAFAAPHFPLHALPEDIALYRDRYLAGWDKLRQERHQRMIRLGLLPATSTLSPLEPTIGPPYPYPDAIAQLGPGEIDRPLPWDELTPEQKRFQATKMAIHAAMIHRMDIEIGRVLDQLKAMNSFENTLILFLSDNGASAEIMVRDDGHDPAAPLGSAATYLCLGPGFSSAANTPFRRHKTWTHEGGISTPFIAHWPAGIPAPQHHHLRHSPAHVIDIAPTLLQLAGASTAALPSAPALPGRSLAPAFLSAEIPVHDALWFFHEGNRALRQGQWKIVADQATSNWALYDLDNDRGEQHDLASSRPELVDELARHWQSLAQSFRRSALQDLSPEQVKALQQTGSGKAKAKGKGKSQTRTQ